MTTTTKTETMTQTTTTKRRRRRRHQLSLFLNVQLIPFVVVLSAKLAKNAARTRDEVVAVEAKAEEELATVVLSLWRSGNSFLESLGLLKDATHTSALLESYCTAIICAN